MRYQRKPLEVEATLLIPEMSRIFGGHGGCYLVSFDDGQQLPIEQEKFERDFVPMPPKPRRKSRAKATTQGCDVRPLLEDLVVGDSAFVGDALPASLVERKRTHK